jgi:putative endonuclease
MARAVHCTSAMREDPRQVLGKLGEDLACAELTRRRYEILERRYRTKYGEIDIIARDGEVTVFVEVKAREGGEFGGGAAAVTSWKQQRLTRMAVDVIARRRLHDRPCRFDVVVVDVSGTAPHVEVFPNAFDASGAYT